ncbi:MAG: outer membrane beta-barrel protein [Bacteroidia bacterium]|nr:outer membrane beta-barrel protein [Bacteroidia bacterium]MDW8014926.1 outer membrane beta-barrel protein [Bacteroidia bacterium]
MQKWALVFIGALLWAQVRIGAVIAPQATTAKGEMDKDYFITGVATGLSGEIAFPDYYAAIGMDLLTSFAGWREEERGYGEVYKRADHRLTTLQVPLYVRAQWLPIGGAGAGLTAIVGTQSDVLLGARVRPEGGSFTRNTSNYGRFAGALLGGLGFSYEGEMDYAMTVDLRISYSFINLKKAKGGRINPAWFMLRVAFYLAQ